ncbi:MAG: hypothetical protein DDG60_16440 [Anaerolineae bacterium]|nr:MAG: hypothetical protein DDG60_16440 [Anaerolineae bacterium]
MDSDQILLRAINLIEAGNKADGRELLRQTVQAEPLNADAWYLYARYCGKRSQAIEALQQVLNLDPAYPNAREALERLVAETPPATTLPKPQPAFVPLEKDDPWNQALQPDPASAPIVPGKIKKEKKKTVQIPRWFLAALAGLFGCLVLGCIGLGMAVMLNRPGNVRAQAIPSPAGPQIPITGSTPQPTLALRPYQTPTPTPDPCTCQAVETYMNAHLARVNQLLTDMDFVAQQLNKKTLKASEAESLAQNAANLYEAQRAETVPPCLENYQKDAVKMFWNWQEATNAIQNGDANGALAFIEIIVTDSQELDAKLAKLGKYPSLQACTFAFPTLTAP